MGSLIYQHLRYISCLQNHVPAGKLTVLVPQTNDLCRFFFEIAFNVTFIQFHPSNSIIHSFYNNIFQIVEVSQKLQLKKKKKSFENRCCMVLK